METCIVGQYSVTDCGEVYTNDYRHKGIRQRLRTQIDKGGYEIATIYIKGVRKDVKVHRLVAEAFIPNPENKPTVNHKDGIKTNNHVDNLEWATVSEQERHSRSTGMKDNKHLERVVVQLDRITGEKVAEYGSLKEAWNTTGIRSSSICSACTGTYETAGGYKWQYKQD